MNHEQNPERLARLSLDFLADELIGAVEYGDAEAVIDALSLQAKTEVTVALSNHLVARSFLVRQKNKLIMLENALTNGLRDEELIRRIQELLDAVREEYKETFVSQNENDEYEKLSGDDAFRDFIAIDAEDDVDDEDIDSEDFISSITLAKWQLIETPIAALDSPAETLKWVKDMGDNIILSMYGVLEEIDKCGGAERDVLWIRDEIAREIDSLDDNILGCFQGK